MKFKFSPSIPESVWPKSTLLSDNTPSEFTESVYMIDADSEYPVAYEIKYEYDFNPFKEGLIVGDILAVGIQNHFYLFDLKTQKNILSQEIEGYFCKIYFDEDKFFVTGASGVYAISKEGKLLWENNRLGVDGVLIGEINENALFLNAQIDPPDGWKGFRLNKKNGLEF
ncbi:hypothetical protein [Flavobacterium sp.]|uniref:hypothetical protein n=1 Tax=Flavobacterium sp. TaxID=239 RepID=UPI0039E5C649